MTKLTGRSVVTTGSPAAPGRGGQPAREPGPARAGSRRRRLPAAERREQILAAAIRCFAAKGYHGATMEDLAREAGLSKGSLYWHFRSKQEVFLALHEKLEAELFAEWERAASRAPDRLEALHRFGEAAMEIFAAAPRSFEAAWMEFLTHRVARRRLAETYRLSRAWLAKWIREGIDRGELRAELDPEATAMGAVALVEGLLLQAIVDPELDVAKRWSAFWELVRRGIQA